VFDLSGQTALITGASGGIGGAIAKALHRQGSEVMLGGTRLGALTALANEMGERVHVGVADLADPATSERLAKDAEATMGRIDILVNNAGIGQASVRADQRKNPIRFWEVTHEQWSRFLAVNATAPIMMARAVVPHMLKAKQGRIITVTTSLGTMVRAGYLLYGSSKAAAESATAVLAADLQGTGVTANVLVPGGVTNTPLVGEDAGDRGKMLQPEIMVPPLLWLVSDAAAGVSARRFIAADWDRSLPAAEAAEKAGAPIAWLGIARMPIEPT
jgi:NAD(P)-dependent dehydrogenase (short-subunit alcohol dehydrogenase family)